MKPISKSHCPLPLLLLCLVVCSGPVLAEEQLVNTSIIRGGTGQQVSIQRKQPMGLVYAKPGDRIVLQTEAKNSYAIVVTKSRKSDLGNNVLHGSTLSGGRALLVFNPNGQITGHIDQGRSRLQIDTDTYGVTRIWRPDPYTELPELRGDAVIPPEDSPIPEAIGAKNRAPIALRSLKNPEPEDPPTVIYPRFGTGPATVRVFFYHDFKNKSASEVPIIIDYLIEYGNEVFANSSIDINLELAGHSTIDLAEADSSDILSAMWGRESPFESISEDQTDNTASFIAVLRDELPEGDEGYGRAYLGGQFSTQRHSVTTYENTYGATVFAHEIGHNLGANHNRGEYTDEELASAYTFPYAYGYYEPEQHRTVMSYSTYGWVPRIPHYSNPAKQYNGYRLGVPYLELDSADVSLAFFNNRHTAAARGSASAFPDEAVSIGARIYESDCGEELEDDDERGQARSSWVSISSLAEHMEIHSTNRVRPDGSVYTYRYPPGYSYGSVYDCRLPDEGDNSLGTDYVESFIRYRLPNGKLVESARVSWEKDYEGAYSEVRVAYNDGGQLVGNSSLMLMEGERRTIAFEPDFGHELAEIKSSCDGRRIGNTYELTATKSDCRVEAIFGTPSSSSQAAQDTFSALLGSWSEVVDPAPPAVISPEKRFIGTYHVYRPDRPGREDVLRIADGASLTLGSPDSDYRWEIEEENLKFYYMFASEPEDPVTGDYRGTLTLTEDTSRVDMIDAFSSSSYWNFYGEKVSDDSEHGFDLYELGRGYYGDERDVLKCYNIGRGYFSFYPTSWYSDSQLPATSTSLEECQSFCADILADYQERDPENWSERVCEGDEVSGNE